MTPLAAEIYRQLIKHLRTGGATITYGELAQYVAKKQPAHHRSPSFHAALTELTHACRSAKLPAITALVCRSSGSRPGSGYYAIAHPRAKTEDAQLSAWEREHGAVLEARGSYPASL